MSRKNFLHMSILVFKRMSQPYYQGVAAELAFFFLLSLVPSAIILGDLLGFFSLSLSVTNELREQ